MTMFGLTSHASLRNSLSQSHHYKHRNDCQAHSFPWHKQALVQMYIRSVMDLGLKKKSGVPIEWIRACFFLLLLFFEGGGGGGEVPPNFHQNIATIINKHYFISVIF